MEADKKIQGATYHLQRMEDFYLKNWEYLIYELEAFLVTVRSVPDVLLEDYNVKFSLGISLGEQLYPKTFEDRARQLQNKQAINFIEWWKKKVNQIRSDKLGSLLFGKRNVSVHRKVVTPDLQKITLHEDIHITESVIIRQYDTNGNLIKEIKSPESPPKPIKSKPAEIDWCFTDYPDDNVVDVSRKLLRIIQQYVEEAKRRFK